MPRHHTLFVSDNVALKTTLWPMFTRHEHPLSPFCLFVLDIHRAIYHMNDDDDEAN